MKKHRNSERKKIADDKGIVVISEDDTIVLPAYEVKRSDIFGR